MVYSKSITSGQVNAQRKARIRNLIGGYVSEETLKQVMLALDAVVYDNEMALALARATHLYAVDKGVDFTTDEFRDICNKEAERNRTKFNSYPYEEEVLVNPTDRI